MPEIRSRLRSNLVLVTVVAAFLAVTIVVFFAIPRSANHTPATILEEPSAPPSAVDLALTVDSIDATTGSMRVRLLALPGDRLPRTGAVVFTSVGGIPTITVAPNRLNQEQAATVLFQNGDVADYPFETYATTIRLAAFEGTDPTIPEGPARQQLSMNVHGVSNVANFTPTSQDHVDKDGIVTIAFQARRTLGTRGWVLAMMAIYWSVALGVAAVTVMIVKRRRAWESRMLAWLGAVVFALVTFRNAAPANPPVGTFFDFFAVFESVGIVAVALVVLIVYYVVQSPERLNLRPPP